MTNCEFYRILHHIVNGKETADPFCMKNLKKCDGKKCELVEVSRKEIREQLEEVKNIVENEVHPVVSPDKWHVYSSLHDELEQLEILLEHNNVI